MVDWQGFKNIITDVIRKKGDGFNDFFSGKVEVTYSEESINVSIGTYDIDGTKRTLLKDKSEEKLFKNLYSLLLTNVLYRLSLKMQYLLTLKNFH